jgi:hypothetical protein
MKGAYVFRQDGLALEADCLPELIIVGHLQHDGTASTKQLARSSGTCCDGMGVLSAV